MEEMFTAVEFIKRNSNSELSIAQFFEDKHGFGAAIKEDDFDRSVLECLSGLTEFVSADIYSNASAFLKSLPVSIYFLRSLLHLPWQQNTQTICSACTSISGIILQGFCSFLINLLTPPEIIATVFAKRKYQKGKGFRAPVGFSEEVCRSGMMVNVIFLCHHLLENMFFISKG